jgi:hypothetical protein
VNDIGAKIGLPTATKDSGAEWYYPALTNKFNRPTRITGGGRYETRYKAKAKAARMIKSGQVNSDLTPENGDTNGTS